MGNAPVEYTSIFIKGHNFFYEKKSLKAFQSYLLSYITLVIFIMSFFPSIYEEYQVYSVYHYQVHMSLL